MRRSIGVMTLIALGACATFGAESEPAPAGGDGGTNGDAAQTGDGGALGADGSAIDGGKDGCGSTVSDPQNCGACGRRCNADGGCSASRCGGLVVFVTSTTYTGGAFGGLAADAQCDALAHAAGLGGHFRVWLAVANVRRFTPVVDGPYYDTNGDLLAPSWPPGGTLSNPIKYDENRVAVTDTGVWSNLDGNGTPLVGNDCAGWGNATVLGAIGSASATNSGWTRSYENEPCGTPHRLYCVESP